MIKKIMTLTSTFITPVVVPNKEEFSLINKEAQENALELKNRLENGSRITHAASCCTPDGIIYNTYILEKEVVVD